MVTSIPVSTGWRGCIWKPFISNKITTLRKEDICTDFCIKILNKTNYWIDRQQTASQGHNHFGQRWPGNNCWSRKNKCCELIRVCKIFQRPNNSKGNSSNQYLHQLNDCCMMTTCSSERKFLIKPWLLSCKNIPSCFCSQTKWVKLSFIYHISCFRGWQKYALFAHNKS